MQTLHTRGKVLSFIYMMQLSQSQTHAFVTTQPQWLLVYVATFISTHSVINFPDNLFPPHESFLSQTLCFYIFPCIQLLRKPIPNYGYLTFSSFSVYTMKMIIQAQGVKEIETSNEIFSTHASSVGTHLTLALLYIKSSHYKLRKLRKGINPKQLKWITRNLQFAFLMLQLMWDFGFLKDC